MYLSPRQFWLGSWLFIGLSLSNLTLAAAKIATAPTKAKTKDELSIQLPSPVSSIEKIAITELVNNRSRHETQLTLSTLFSSPTNELKFSDSFVRSRVFESSLNRIEVAVSQEKLWETNKRTSIGPALSLGFTRYTGSDQELYDIPLTLKLKSKTRLNRRFSVISSAGAQVAAYWSNYSTTFSSLSGWGYGTELNTGLGISIASSQCEILANWGSETRNKNQNDGFGFKIGWGITL